MSLTPLSPKHAKALAFDTYLNACTIIKTNEHDALILFINTTIGTAARQGDVKVKLDFTTFYTKYPEFSVELLHKVMARFVQENYDSYRVHEHRYSNQDGYIQLDWENPREEQKSSGGLLSWMSSSSR